MTIDERLEKLTERHEALAQSLEIVAGMQRENEKKIGQLTTQDGQLGTQVGQLATQIGQFTTLMGQSLQSLNQLARIAEAH